MEVLAAIELVLLNVTMRLSIEHVISMNWKIPKDENMTKYQDDPVHYKFALLLACDLGSALIEAATAFFTSVHFLKEVLSCIALHVKVTCFHSLEFDSHRPLSACSLKHFFLTEEAASCASIHFR